MKRHFIHMNRAIDLSLSHNGDSRTIEHGAFAPIGLPPMHGMGIFCKHNEVVYGEPWPLSEACL
jgi:hypothetical protein